MKEIRERYPKLRGQEWKFKLRGCFCIRWIKCLEIFLYILKSYSETFLIMAQRFINLSVIFLNVLVYFFIASVNRSNSHSQIESGIKTGPLHFSQTPIGQVTNVAVSITGLRNSISNMWTAREHLVPQLPAKSDIGVAGRYKTEDCGPQCYWRILHT